MSQPEGLAIGNALEVREAIATLRGEGPPDVLELCAALGEALGVEGVPEAIGSGAALDKLRTMIAAQGGDPRVVDEPDLLPQAAVVGRLAAPRSGWLSAVNAECLGRIVVGLGAGRVCKEGAIDPSAGLVLSAKIGDRVEAGQPLLEVHASAEARLQQALTSAAGVFEFSDRPVTSPQLVTAIIPAS
jgi:pyrimidine-nucleoside phosphorylase